MRSSLLETKITGESLSTRKKVRSFSASDIDQQMLDELASYHGFSKSAMLTSLVKKEFWRVFPSGTKSIQADAHAFVFKRERNE